MRYVRGLICVEPIQFKNMEKFLKGSIYNISEFYDYIRFKNTNVFINIRQRDRRLSTLIEIEENGYKRNYKEVNSEISNVIGLKKVITKDNIYLINIVQEDTDFKTAKSNLCLLFYDCKKKNTTLEDFKNFFDLDNKIELMKYIFCTLVKINEVDKDLAQSIRSKLDYYGYSEEFYPKFGYSSKEATDKKSNTDKIIEQCLSVLYYHIENTNTDEYPKIENYIYKKYKEFLELLKKEGELD